MSDRPKKRRWLQIHLSTAIVLMFASGALMWANLTPRTVEDQHHATRFNWFQGPTCFIEGRSSGWPLAAVLRYEAGPAAYDPCEISQWRIAFDAVIALALLGGIWFVCEWWIHRRSYSEIGN